LNKDLSLISRSATKFIKGEKSIEEESLSFTRKAKFTRFSSVTKKEIEKCQGKVKDFLRGVGIARLDL